MANVTRVTVSAKQNADYKASWNWQCRATEITISETYTVEFDDINTYGANCIGVSDPKTGFTVPLIGSNYWRDPIYPGTAHSITPKVDPGGANVWRVHVEYSTLTPNGAGTTNPVLQLQATNIKLVLGAQAVRETVYSSFDPMSGFRSIPIINSAGDYFDPTVEETFWVKTISLEFDSAFVNPDDVDKARGNVNEDTITLRANGLTRNYQPMTLKLAEATCNPVAPGTTNPLWHFSYLFHNKDLIDSLDGSGNALPNGGGNFGKVQPGSLDQSGFVTRIQDRGYHIIQKSDQTKKVAQSGTINSSTGNGSDSGTSFSAPVALNGKGYLPTTATDPPFYFDHWLLFQVSFMPLLKGVS